MSDTMSDQRNVRRCSKGPMRRRSSKSQVALDMSTHETSSKLPDDKLKYWSYRFRALIPLQYFASPEVEQRFEEGPSAERARLYTGAYCWICGCILPLFNYLWFVLEFSQEAKLLQNMLPRLAWLAIGLGVGLLHHFVPAVRRYSSIVGAILCVVIGAYHGWLVHAFSTARTEQSKTSLHLVWRLAESDPEATEQLRTYLDGLIWSTTTVNNTLWMVLEQYLMAQIGFQLSITVGLTLSSCVFLVIIQLGDHLPVGKYVTVCAASAVSVVIMLYIAMRVQSKHRRWFAAEWRNSVLFQGAVQASRQADSILNHGLKNTMADAFGRIELFLDSEPTCDPTKIVLLEKARILLQRGMWSCRHRQAYVQLAGASYSLCHTVMNLQSFGRGLIAGRQLSENFPDLHVYLEEVLCSLVLDNVITNAFTHGHPTDPDVCFTIREEQDAIVSSPDDAGEYVQLTFQVTNRANPEKPVITDQFIAERLAGVRHAQAAALSDQIGLKHAYKAAEALGVEPHFTQEDDRVVFKMVVTVKKAQGPRDNHITVPAASADVFPKGLNIYCIDDSSGARLLLSTALKKHLLPRNVHTFGKVPKDCEDFVRGVMKDGDIAILDQNIDMPGHSFLGTDLSRRLVALKFTGLICIRSANNSEEDMALYRNSGAQCILPKDLQMKELLMKIKEAYLVHRPPVPVPAADPVAGSVSNEDLQMCRTSLSDSSSITSIAAQGEAMGEAAGPTMAEGEASVSPVTPPAGNTPWQFAHHFAPDPHWPSGGSEQNEPSSRTV